MTKASWELLLAVEHDEGVAGVYRDREDGFHWLSGAEDGGSRIERRRFTFEGLRAAWACAGFLPAGAVRVMARDAHGEWCDGAAGHGVWLAITRAMPLAVRFEDARGGIVRRPLDALEHEPAPDATAACAACGASGWDEALLAPVHPGESEHRAVVCRRCGHEVAMGVWYGGVGQPTDPQPPADWWRERADTMRWVFAEARFPVYGLATWEGERCWTGHGTSLGRVTDVSLGFGSRPGVVVDTSSVGTLDSHERELERKLLQLATPGITAAAWQRLSPAALTVLMEQDRLRAGARVAAVVAREHAIRVDGRPEPFLIGRCGDGWAAVATLEDVTVTITADQVAPEAVALERVTDVEPYLQPPRG